MSDDIDFIDSDGLDQDIATDYRDDSGTHRIYITWWRRTYLRAIFPVDLPRGDPRPWRQEGNKQGFDASEEDSDDQGDDIEEQEVGGDRGNPNTREGDQDGDDDEYEEEEEDEEEEDVEEEDEEEDEEEEEDEDEDAEDKDEEEESGAVHHSREDTTTIDPSILP